MERPKGISYPRAAVLELPVPDLLKRSKDIQNMALPVKDQRCCDRRARGCSGIRFVVFSQPADGLSIEQHEWSTESSLRGQFGCENIFPGTQFDGKHSLMIQ